MTADVIATFPKNKREAVRIALDRWQGHDLVDIRVVVDLTAACTVQTPTKKGISVAVESLPELIAGLQRAEVRARELGLLPGQEGSAA